jgi:putative ABC transport system permease protein
VEKIGDRFPGWISESMARRFQLEKGSRIDLPTPDGEKSISITGIFAEYGNETGTLIVAREHTSQWFDDKSVSNLAVYLDENAEPEKVLEVIREQFPTLTVQTNARLRNESIRIFHQTFAVTYALEAIAVIIAVSGLGLALAGLLLERKSELATLKSLGASRSEIARGAMWEGIGLSLVGFAGGIILSFFLGWVLIHVINPQSFGWTLTYRVPWVSFFALGGITIAAAAIVARLVGFKNANLRSDTRE